MFFLSVGEVNMKRINKRPERKHQGRQLKKKYFRCGSHRLCGVGSVLLSTRFLEDDLCPFFCMTSLFFHGSKVSAFKVHSVMHARGERD